MTKGTPCPEWLKQKLSEAMTGKPKSAEATRKMALTKIGNKYRLGKSFSDESRQKSRDSHLGKKHSEEAKAKMSASRMGRKGAMAGKTHSQEAREKMKASYSGSNKGEKHYRWKGGVTPLTKSIRYSFKYRQWRSDVFTRDDFTCVLCGEKGGYIEADHYPKSFSSIFCDNEITSIDQALACEEFWNINNGRTLCRKCHDTTKKGR